ncbi:biotin--[acetyl-CoA-carboxylase] ligase [Candidatus Gastranaerophilales bacterium]|nr:MAG: biotin--[acetyl-CoA-carboxylase] ligase [Candidatus Gastranaerophilales bacterium]
MEFLYLDEVDSTNLYGKKNIDTLADKTVISAKRQLSGRGRLNRVWLDLGEGNLFVSVVLKPSLKFDEKFANLTQYLSVILCKTLEQYGLQPEIKWPNDVLINGKKVAGILSETVMQGQIFKGLVLGFGINISAGERDVKQVTDKAVTSVSLELGKQVDGKLFLNDLLNLFFRDYNKFLESGFEFIKHDYIKRVNFLEKELCVKVFNDTKCGVAKGINDNGALILEKNNEKFVLIIGDIL